MTKWGRVIRTLITVQKDPIRYLEDPKIADIDHALSMHIKGLYDSTKGSPETAVNEEQLDNACQEIINSYEFKTNSVDLRKKRVECLRIALDQIRPKQA